VLLTGVSVLLSAQTILTSRAAIDREGKLNSMLAALPAMELALLSSMIREVSLSRGMVLHEPGDPVEHVYFPHEAVISLVTVLQDGQSIETATIGREAALDMTSALSSASATARAVVRVPGTAARIGAADFRAATTKSLLLRDFATRCNQLLIAQTQQSAACNALHNTEARICRWLLDYSDRAGDALELTQDLLAQALGVRRTTVTLIAQLLQTAGMIRYRRGVIQILDRAALEQSACECYRTIRQQVDGLLPESRGEPKSA
jgi:CRP-like cAMP-binding protein